MKKLLCTALCLILLIGVISAQEMIPVKSKQAIESPRGIRNVPSRTVPEYTFSRLPNPLLTSYYDYMIGSYNGMPLRVIPQNVGGGYFLTYHGRRTATGTRRVFYAHLDSQGNMINNSEITADNVAEGYPTIAVDPVSGKPMYAWHANGDADTQNETRFTSDAFLDGLSGLFNDVINVIDNPITITPPGGTATTDNEFIWPTATIGPSPVAGKRRIYVVARNYISHISIPSENMYLKYADFDASDIENGVTLNWSSNTIPILDGWNHDATISRRPNFVITADDSGKLYYIGYHDTYDLDSNVVLEDDLDVFSCDYGVGDWTLQQSMGRLPTWNPEAAPTGTAGYFTDDSGNPYPDTSLYWGNTHSGHLNAGIDTMGRIHLPQYYFLNTTEGTYYPNIHNMKQMIYDPTAAVGSRITIEEIYPVKDSTNTVDLYYQPWDLEAPWGVVDEWGGNATDGYYPLISSEFNFCYWDTSVHDDQMMFHYGNQRVTNANDSGMMAVVWQNSWRAKQINEYADPDYSAYANSPEIYILVSSDNGNNWSDPIVLNNVDTPQLAGLKPMWVYPADQVIRMPDSQGRRVGKLGLMFYDDYTWGSNVVTPPVHANADGGQVMFMELEIVFPTGANEDPTVPAATPLLSQNYPNPFNPETTISFQMPKAAPVRLAIYNVKGQLVKVLHDGTASQGDNSVVWDGTDAGGNAVSSGIYFSRLESGSKTEIRKMMLMK